MWKWMNEQKWMISGQEDFRRRRGERSIYHGWQRLENPVPSRHQYMVVLGNTCRWSFFIAMYEVQGNESVRSLVLGASVMKHRFEEGSAHRLQINLALNRNFETLLFWHAFQTIYGLILNFSLEYSVCHFQCNLIWRASVFCGLSNWIQIKIKSSSPAATNKIQK